jgi:outer membrane receptor protein involved in Fe transport
VTTTSRSAERASVAPATIFTLSADEMMASGARTVDEALELLGLGVYVAKRRDYTSDIDVGAQGLLLRGAGRHVLVMLDGVILNSQGTGRISLHEALGVPFDLIDHIEVMLGPGSVIYGSNAMLAVINIVTRRARELGRARAAFEVGVAAPQDTEGRPTSIGAGGRLGLRYRIGAGGGARFRIGRTEGEVAAMLEWIHEESAGYGVTPFTMGEAADQSFLPGQAAWGGSATHSMRAPSGAISLRLGDLRLLVSGFHYYRTMPLVGTFNDPFAREEQGGVRVDLRHGWQITPKLRLDSRLYGGYSLFAERSRYGESFWCPEGLDGCRFEASARSGWLGLEQIFTADWFVDGKVVTSVAYDLRPRFLDSTPADYSDLNTGVMPEGLLRPHLHDTSFVGAISAQQIWRPLPWLSLNAGGRLDIDSGFGLRFSPRAAVVLTPAPGRGPTLRVSYNEAFRAPSVYEITEFDPTYRISPTNLRPETVRSAELEVQQRAWRVQLSLRGYATFYDGLIESRLATAEEVAAAADHLSPTVDPEVVIVNDNIRSLHVFGGSLSAHLRLPSGFSLGGTVNAARTQTPEGEAFQRMPLVFGNFRAGWQRGADGPSISLVGVFAGEREILQSFNPIDARLGPRVDLRLTAAGPLSAVKAPGLRWRATLGFDVNPELP